MSKHTTWTCDRCGENSPKEMLTYEVLGRRANDPGSIRISSQGDLMLCKACEIRLTELLRDFAKPLGITTKTA